MANFAHPPIWQKVFGLGYELAFWLFKAGAVADPQVCINSKI